jgi:hypothetical protein
MQLEVVGKVKNNQTSDFRRMAGMNFIATDTVSVNVTLID